MAVRSGFVHYSLPLPFRFVCSVDYRILVKHWTQLDTINFLNSLSVQCLRPPHTFTHKHETLKCISFEELFSLLVSLSGRFYGQCLRQLIEIISKNFNFCVCFISAFIVCFWTTFCDECCLKQFLCCLFEFIHWTGILSLVQLGYFFRLF